MPVQMIPVLDFERMLLAVVLAVGLVVLGYLLGRARKE